jgi:hypothetical protein
MKLLKTAMKRRRIFEMENCTNVSFSLLGYSVLIGMIENKSISVPVSFLVDPKKSNKIVKTKALIDSGAGGKFINQNFAQNLKLKQH